MSNAANRIPGLGSPRRGKHWLAAMLLLLGSALGACGDDGGGSMGAAGSSGQAGSGSGSTQETSLCDTSAAATVTCGGRACPELSDFARRLCLVPCCVQERCGIRNTSEMADSECRLQSSRD